LPLPPELPVFPAPPVAPALPKPELVPPTPALPIFPAVPAPALAPLALAPAISWLAAPAPPVGASEPPLQAKSKQAPQLTNTAPCLARLPTGEL